MGRGDQLAEIVQSILLQLRIPDRIIICISETDPVPDCKVSYAVEVIRAERGLPKQRNAIIAVAEDCDIILFLDDDFVLSPAYIQVTMLAFENDPTVVATTGFLLADGSRKAGYNTTEAQEIIAQDSNPIDAGSMQVPHAYGCNMALRLSIVRKFELQFDERLPLYAWSEDIDFSHRIGRYGLILELTGARGVHLGTKQGRTSGYKLGYSQIANPIYLYGKGSYTFGRATRSVGRNMIMNLIRALLPEPYIDRYGRLRGNFRAIIDMVRGCMYPERILEL